MISVVIPSRNDDINLFRDTLNCILAQDLKPKELVVVDSSSNSNVEKLLKDINFHEIAIIYKKIEGTFAGKSTNIGMKLANEKYIALLDTKTKPKPNWLSTYINFIEKEGLELVFGNTKFFSHTWFQDLIRMSSYGDSSHETVPGTVFLKSKLYTGIFFIENVRSSYDIEWRNRVKEKLLTKTPNVALIEYEDFPKNFQETVKKYFIYSFYTAIVNVQKDAKDLYLSVFLIATALIIPRWNFFLDGWDANPLYIADVTKKYFLSILAIFFSLLVTSRFFPQSVKENLAFNTLKYLAYLFIFLAIFNWNAVVAEWVEDATFYIPHITKIFIFFVILTSIFIRGIFKPLSNEVKLEYLLPLRWLFIGMMGLIIDIVKAPGYVIGSIISKFR
jgi:glycosyltransferase involved in cell wall biosynthesis